MRNAALFLLIVFLLGSFAHASDQWAFLPDQSDAQKDLKASIQHGDFRRALEAWPKATQGSIFAESENGRALYDLLLAENGLPVSAMKRLMQNTSVADIDPVLMGLWRPILNSYVADISPGWNMNASWMRLFPSNVAPITRAKQIPQRLKAAERLPNDDINKAKQLWQIATIAPQFNDVHSALTALTDLRSCKQNYVGGDQIEIATARVYYQKGDVKEALKHYESIPKSSDFWLETVEERTWAYLRLKDNDRAVGELTTVLSPAFAKMTGPEPYFLSELESLKVCDYPKILKTSRLFKERHKERLTELERLAKTGDNKGLGPMLSSLDKNGYSLEAVGPNIQWMPQHFLRDRQFAGKMKFRLDLLAEIARANGSLKSAVAEDPSLAGQMAGEQAEADQARQAAVNRLRQLAKVDLNEYKVVLNKLHIVEAELIERLYVDETLKGKRQDIEPFKDAHNTISFPYSDQEIWIDELDHYQSRIQNCPSLPGTKGASL